MIAAAVEPDAKTLTTLPVFSPPRYVLPIAPFEGVGATSYTFLGEYTLVPDDSFLPSCPTPVSFLPHDHTFPSLSTASEKLSPAATETMLSIGLPFTRTSVGSLIVFLVVLNPACPLELSPHVYTWPLLARARVNWFPVTTIGWTDVVTSVTLGSTFTSNNEYFPEFSSYTTILAEPTDL